MAAWLTAEGCGVVVSHSAVVPTSIDAVVGQGSSCAKLTADAASTLALVSIPVVVKLASFAGGGVGTHLAVGQRAVYRIARAARELVVVAAGSACRGSELLAA